MNPNIISNLTWEDLKEIMNVVNECNSSTYASEKDYYRKILRILRMNNVDKHTERFLYLTEKAEEATGYKATRKRDYGSILTRSFVSYRLWKEGMTYLEIGKISEKCHATVINQVNKVKDMMSLPKMYDAELRMYAEFEDSLEDGKED